MRKRSRIDREKQISLIESARRMTPEERLAACINLSKATSEFHEAGKKYREGKKSKPS